AAGGAYDVIVAGGGPAGLGAALASAGNGAKTLLLESRGFLGGVGSLALWMPMNRLFAGGASRGGIHEKFVRKILSYGKDASVPGEESFTAGDNLDIHPDYLRLAAYELLEEAGCYYRLYSPVTGVLMDGKKITGVVVNGKNGREEYRAKVMIDATGDGDLAFFAGAEIVEGREEDGIHMPLALVFAIANVDEEKFYAFFADKEKYRTVLKEAREEGYLTAAWYAFDRTTLPGVVSVNNGGIYNIGNLDGKDARDLTVAERMGSKAAMDFITFARRKIPGMETCRLARLGSAVAVRDTRRIVGDYTLTVEDARTGPYFDDAVARKFGSIDANQLYVGEMKSGFHYPYRCMLPKGIENLLAAGRCGSATFLGHAAGKSMGNMMALGQGAGVAAALSARFNTAPRSLDVKLVQKALADMGVDLAVKEKPV
ncbi:MAG: FAD-dependent oxidoreductase, partial [Treponema sp.]|nr:FAD-dependent oxidoreductase [Treponema sp.]